MAGTIALRGPTQERAADKVDLATRRAYVTLVATLCSDARVQARIPQILLGNEHVLTKDLLGLERPSSLRVWRRKSGWCNQEILKEYLTLLKRSLEDVMASHTVVLVWDCAPCHLQESVAQRAQSLGFRVACIPARATACLQPCDLLLFRRLKHAIRLSCASAKAESVDGRLEPKTWLRSVMTATHSILTSISWKKGFSWTGALGCDRNSDTLQGPLSDEEISLIFPHRFKRGAEMVEWKPPTCKAAAASAHMLHGRIVRTLD